jgi:hypothetical protein
MTDDTPDIDTDRVASLVDRPDTVHLFRVDTDDPDLARETLAELGERFNESALVATNLSLDVMTLTADEARSLAAVLEARADDLDGHDGGGVSGTFTSE